MAVTMAQNGNKFLSQDSRLAFANGSNANAMEMHCNSEDCDDVDCIEKDSIIKIRTCAKKYVAINCMPDEKHDSNHGLVYFNERRKGHNQFQISYSEQLIYNATDEKYEIDSTKKNRPRLAHAAFKCDHTDKEASLYYLVAKLNKEPNKLIVNPKSSLDGTEVVLLFMSKKKFLEKTKFNTNIGSYMPLIVDTENNAMLLYIEDKEYQHKSTRKYVYVYDNGKVTIELLDSTCIAPAEALFDRHLVQSSSDEICTNTVCQLTCNKNLITHIDHKNDGLDAGRSIQS